MQRGSRQCLPSVLKVRENVSFTFSIVYHDIIVVILVIADTHDTIAGVSMGTRFLACEESDAQPAHKKLLLQRDNQRPTVLTRAFTGKAVRAIVNGMKRFFREIVCMVGR